MCARYRGTHAVLLVEIYIYVIALRYLLLGRGPTCTTTMTTGIVSRITLAISIHYTMVIPCIVITTSIN